MAQVALYTATKILSADLETLEHGDDGRRALGVGDVVERPFCMSSRGVDGLA